MRKFTLALTLGVVLLISTTAVYAAVSWDGDPPCGDGIYAAWTMTTEGAPDGWSPDFQCQAEVEEEEGEAVAWLGNYDEDDFTCTMTVTFSDGEDGPVVAEVTGSCEEVEAEWGAD